MSTSCNSRRKAEVQNLEMLSAQADAGEIIDWPGAMPRRPRRVFVVHGEAEGGCMVWDGAVSLSPADDIPIRVSRVMDLDVEAQLVGSILSKKIAAGSTHLVIDLPVGHGIGQERAIDNRRLTPGRKIGRPSCFWPTCYVNWEHVALAWLFPTCTTCARIVVFSPVRRSLQKLSQPGFRAILTG